MKQSSPLVALAAAVCAGIVLGQYSRTPFWVFWAAALVCLGLSLTFVNRRIGIGVLLFAAFCLGGSLLRMSQHLPANHIARFTPPKGVPVYLEGVVVTEPVEQKRNLSFILETEKLKQKEFWREVAGKVLVKAYEKQEFTHGQRLLLEGKLYQVPSFRISERLNYRDYLGRKGIYSVLSVRKGNTVDFLEKNQGAPFKAYTLRAKHRMRGVIEDYLSPLSGRMLAAIILGERQQLDPSLKRALSATGTIHVIAISGLHLGIVTFIVLILLKAMRIPRFLRYPLTVFFLLCYCFLTGARLPVVRATVMTSLLLLGLALKRDTAAPNSLAAAALIILFVNPAQLFEASFQLSFVSIISLLYLSPKIMDLFPERLKRIRCLRVLPTVFSAAAAVWLGLLPLIAYYFRTLSLIAVPANMIVVPFMTIVIASGFTFIFAGVFSPALASIFSPGSEISLQILLRMIAFFETLPGGYFHLPAGIPPWVVVVYYGMVFGGFSLIPRKRDLPEFPRNVQASKR